MRRLVNFIISSGLLSGILILGMIAVDGVGALEPVGDVPPTANPHVLLKTSKGEMLVELFPENAPEMVGFFLEQVKNGNYNRLPVKRYVDGFAIQLANTKKADSAVVADERNNGLRHVKGTVGLVWDYVKNTNGNKLYICLSSIPQLNNKHTVIGQVVEGLEVLSGLRTGDRLEKVSQVKQPSAQKVKAKK